MKKKLVLNSEPFIDVSIDFFYLVHPYHIRVCPEIAVCHRPVLFCEASDHKLYIEECSQALGQFWFHDRQRRLVLCGTPDLTESYSTTKLFLTASKPTSSLVRWIASSWVIVKCGEMLRFPRSILLRTDVNFDNGMIGAYNHGMWSYQNPRPKYALEIR